jgi:hypothetical protein
MHLDLCQLCLEGKNPEMIMKERKQRLFSSCKLRVFAFFGVGRCRVISIRTYYLLMDDDLYSTLHSGFVFGRIFSSVGCREETMI